MKVNQYRSTQTILKYLKNGGKMYEIILSCLFYTILYPKKAIKKLNQPKSHNTYMRTYLEI